MHDILLHIYLVKCVISNFPMPRRYEIHNGQVEINHSNHKTYQLQQLNIMCLNYIGIEWPIELLLLI